MSTRYLQLENNGWKLTNELGFILQDRTFGVVQARLVSVASACACPTKTVSCLKIPCPLLLNKCQNITLPLFDAATRAPFRIKAGTLIESIIILKNENCCLDNCLQFVLGTICGNDCDTECDPQRWVSESCPISGAQLNKCGAIKVDVTKRNKCNCPLYLCRTNECPGQCGPKFRARHRPCDERGPPEGGCDHCDDHEHDCDVDPETGCPCLVVDHGCCEYRGGCGEFAGGLLSDCLIGITLLSGDLCEPQSILIAIETWERACLDDCAPGCIDLCPGVPQFVHGGF